MGAYMIQRLRVFGDSILKGVEYDDAQDRYLSLPSEYLEQWEMSHHISVRNNAIFGCTVTKGMQLLRRAIAKNLACDAALLEFGGNDCDFHWDHIASDPHGEHESLTPLDLFGENLHDMIGLLREQRVTPLLMTLPPIDSSRYLAHICRNGLDRGAILRWLGSVENIGRRQELYSLRIATIAVETGVPLIDVRSGFLSRRDCADLLCADGIHPTREGNRLIWSLIAERLRARKIA